MEYEDVLNREGMVPLGSAAISDVLDYIFASGLRQQVHFFVAPKTCGCAR